MIVIIFNFQVTRADSLLEYRGEPVHTFGCVSGPERCWNGNVPAAKFSCKVGLFSFAAAWWKKKRTHNKNIPLLIHPAHPFLIFS